MHKKAALILIFMLLAAAAVAVLSRCTSCLSAQLEAIEDAVIQIRQLEPLEDAALNIQTRAEYEAELAERFEEDFSDEDTDDGLLFYRALDLIEPDVDLEAAYFNFLTANIGGYYDPETDEMTVILDDEQGTDDELPPPESMTYAHEFAHALQDQHYDLEALHDQVIEADNYDFQLAMDISTYSLIGLARGAFPLMKDRGGCILAMTYYPAAKVIPGYQLMSITKAALDNIIRNLAYDLAPHRIRVNGLSPGPTATKAGTSIPGFAVMQDHMKRFAPLQAEILNSDTGRAALFLCSPLADKITGEIVHIDGGYNILGMSVERPRDE